MSRLALRPALRHSAHRHVAAAAEAGFVGAYDDIPSIMAAYGMRRLLASYESNLVRIRRSSDNVEQDFGYVENGDLDVAAIATFIGGGSGFVVTRYDQSGNGNHVTQATATAQPLYVASGQNGRPVSRYDGAGDRMDNAAFPDFPDAASVLMACKLNSGKPSMGLLDIHTGAANSGITLLWTGNTMYWRVVSGGTLTDTTAAFTVPATKILTGTYGVDLSALYVNGALANSTVAAGTLDNTLSKLTIGDIQSATWDFSGDVFEIVIANAEWSTADREAAEQASADYWGITLS